MSQINVSQAPGYYFCLLIISDAAYDRLCGERGVRRTINKENNKNN